MRNNMSALYCNPPAASSASSSAPSFPSDGRCQLAFNTSWQRSPASASTIKLSHKGMVDEVSPAPSLAPYLKHSKRCNFGLEKKSCLVPFPFEGSEIGYVNPKFLENLGQFSDVFKYDIDGDKRGKVQRKGHFLALNPTLKTKDDRTEAMNDVVKALHSQGLLPKPHGELYSVSTHYEGDTIFSLDRGYAPYFGVQGYAVHVNGYVEIEGEKRVWVAKRSLSKSTYPGHFDQLVAGGLPEGLSSEENVIKECWEEAGIPRKLAEKAMPVSVLGYEQIEGQKFERYVLFCYDLRLPENFVPQCTDGEVESFNLLPTSCIKEILETSTMFKPSCAIVTIDFLARQGMIKPEQDGYLALLKSLRTGNCL